MGRGSGGGVRFACGYVDNSASRCGLCGDVDGRDRRRCARSGGRRAVVGRCCRESAVPGVRMESLRADAVFSRGIRRPPGRVAGPCRAAVSAGVARQSG